VSSGIPGFCHSWIAIRARIVGFVPPLMIQSRGAQVAKGGGE